MKSLFRRGPSSYTTIPNLWYGDQDDGSLRWKSGPSDVQIPRDSRESRAYFRKELDSLTVTVETYVTCPERKRKPSMSKRKIWKLRIEKSMNTRHGWVGSWGCTWMWRTYGKGKGRWVSFLSSRPQIQPDDWWNSQRIRTSSKFWPNTPKSGGGHLTFL